MMLPVLFESFLPSLVIQPCAKTREGGGSPAAMSNPGQ